MDARKPPQRPRDTAGTGEWRLDPSEVQLHRRRLKEAQRTGPLGRLVRIAAVGLVLVGAVTVYLNFETLRELKVSVPLLSTLFEGDVLPGVRGLPRAGADGETVAAPAVVGDALPTSLSAEPEPLETATVPAPAAPAPAPAEPAATEAPVLAAAPPPPPPPPPEPEIPAAPETFDFGLSVISVSEAEASAAVLVLRNGGRRGVSTVTWWTTDGTATAGSDYANLGRQTLRFAAGEQNRTVRVPIIGDRNVEGPESFFIHVAPGDSDRAVSQVEVIINDDD